MPLALLLQKVLDVFGQVTDHLSGWARLLEVESLLVGRAGTALNAISRNSDRLGDWAQLIRLEALLVRRIGSAFLVHWFGTRFPMDGSALRITIANLDALRARYATLEAKTGQPAPDGLDIGVPLASMLGTAFGSMVVNPASLLIVLTDGTLKCTTRLLFLLAVVVGAVLPGLSPVVLLLSPVLLVAGPQAANDGYPLLLAIGAMLPPLTDFMDALSANWEPIVGSIVALGWLLLGDAFQNPGLPGPSRDWMAIFDALVPLLNSAAALMPLLLSGLWLLIVAIGPGLQPLAALLVPLVGFVESSIDVIKMLFGDFMAGMSSAFDSKTGVLVPVLTVLSTERQLFEAIGRELSTLMDPWQALLNDVWDGLKAAFDRWWTEVKAAFTWLFNTHPTMVFINALKDWITSAMDVLAEAWHAVKLGVVIGSGAVSPALPSLLAPHLLKPAPTSPAYFPDADEIFNRLAPPAPFASLLFSPAAPGPLPVVPPELLQRRSVFAAARAELRAQYGRDPAGALGILHAQETQLRAFLFDVVGRLLPPEARKSIERLRPQLQAIDKTLRSLERPPHEAPPYPVKALPEVTQVKLIIRRLRIHGVGADKASLVEWAAGVRDALSRQTHPVGVSA